MNRDDAGSPSKRRWAVDYSRRTLYRPPPGWYRRLQFLAPPILLAYLRREDRAGSRGAAREARVYFGVSTSPSVEEIQSIVEHYPVFHSA